MIVADSVEGGLGAAAIAHARWFDSFGYQVCLVAPGAATVTVGRVSVHPLPPVASASHLRSLGRAAVALWRELRRIQPEIVHAHGTRSQLICLLAGRRPYVTMHGTGGRVTGQGVVGSFLRRCARRTAALLAIRAYSVAPAGGRWRTLLHASPRLAELTERPFRPESVPTMVWIGRLEEPKQPDVFVAACALAARETPLRGLVVGDGPARERVVQLVHELNAPVKVVGAVDDVAAVLERARAVCLFSGFEGVPFTVQEAMWVGRPLVLSPLPTLRWFSGDTARWATDVDQAAQALVALCDGRVAAKEGRLAAQRVRTLLTPDAPFPQLLEDYARSRRTSR